MDNNKLYKSSEVANILNVKLHTLHHDTKKYKVFLGDNVKLHPNGKYKLYNNEAVKILKEIRFLVKKRKKTEEIFDELYKILDIPTHSKVYSRESFEMLQLINDRVSSIADETKITTNRLNRIFEMLKNFENKPDDLYFENKTEGGIRGVVNKMLSLFMK